MFLNFKRITLRVESAAWYIIVDTTAKLNSGKRQIQLLRMLAVLFSIIAAGCVKDNSINTQSDINAQKVKDDALIVKYLTNNNIQTTGVVDSAGMPTGIYYKVDSIGTDSTLYTGSTQITVGYTCWVLNTNATLGAVVQQTGQFNPSFILGDLMEGWELPFEFIPLKQVPGVGGAMTLYVPSHYAYGPYPQATLGLPANSVLIFHIIIYNVLN